MQGGIDDSALLHAIRNGDESAFATLVTSYRDGLYNYIAHLLHSDTHADDILQDLFAKLWVQRADLQVTGSVRAYLYTAARNRAFDHQAKQRIRTQYQEREQRGADLDSPQRPTDVVEHDELAEAVRSAIDGLPPRCREIFVLSREEGLSYQEIAETLRVSSGTVKTQMSRAIAALRAVADRFS